MSSSTQSLHSSHSHSHSPAPHTSNTPPPPPPPPRTTASRSSTTVIRQDRQARNKDPRTGSSIRLGAKTRDGGGGGGGGEISGGAGGGAVSLSSSDDEDGDGGGGGEEEDEDEEGRGVRGGGRREKLKISYTDDSYEAVERRRWAATILDSPEMLMMHAQARQDTIPSTRLHFTKLLCGYEDPPRRRTKKPRARRSGVGGREAGERAT